MMFDVRTAENETPRKCTVSGWVHGYGKREAGSALGKCVSDMHEMFDSFIEKVVEHRVKNGKSCLVVMLPL